MESANSEEVGLVPKCFSHLKHDIQMNIIKFQGFPYLSDNYLSRLVSLYFATTNKYNVKLVL